MQTILSYLLLASLFFTLVSPAQSEQAALAHPANDTTTSLFTGHPCPSQVPLPLAHALPPFDSAKTLACVSVCRCEQTYL